jgi:hypothetical protein
MGLLKESTDRAQLAADLQGRLGHASQGTGMGRSGQEQQQEVIGYAKQHAKLDKKEQQQQQLEKEGFSGSRSADEGPVGGHVNIRFGRFAQVLLVLAVKYR